MKPKPKRIIGIKRTTFFSGIRRVGIDTNILIKLYQNPALFSYEESRIFNYKDTIFIHAFCRYEFIRYLMKENKLNFENAKSDANSFLKNHNIKVIYPKNCFITKEEMSQFEKYSNKKLNEKRLGNLKCHYPDSMILLAFKKCQINKVISTDRSFRECARLLGIDSLGLPSLDYAISRELRKIFNYRKKHKRHKKKH